VVTKGASRLREDEALQRRSNRAFEGKGPVHARGRRANKSSLTRVPPILPRRWLAICSGAKVPITLPCDTWYIRATHGLKGGDSWLQASIQEGAENSPHTPRGSPGRTVRARSALDRPPWPVWALAIIASPLALERVSQFPSARRYPLIQPFPGLSLSWENACPNCALDPRAADNDSQFGMTCFFPICGLVDHGVATAAARLRRWGEGNKDMAPSPVSFLQPWAGRVMYKSMPGQEL